MLHSDLMEARSSEHYPDTRRLAAGVLVTSAALLVTELALTRIFSVTMYYHFAFLAISIALLGLSASGVYVYLASDRLAAIPTTRLLARYALLQAAGTILSVGVLVRIRPGLNFSRTNVLLMLATYAAAALPFLAGGATLATAFARRPGAISALYGADLAGAAAACLLLLPLLDRLGAPATILLAAGASAGAGVLFAPRPDRLRTCAAGALILLAPALLSAVGLYRLDVSDTKGHQGDRVLFSKWNSFSRVAVYDRPHGDWSLSPRYHGPLPDSRFMDIDSAASTPILRLDQNAPPQVEYLRYELTALPYHLKEGTGDLRALVIGPGGGRDLASALLFGAVRVDGVEINPIIARDVMQGRFHAYSGGLYTHPRVRIHIDDGRSFIRRSSDRYDVVQASLVDTWAATAAGAYTLTENTLYTVEAFEDYLDHLRPDGMLAVTRWVFDGLRLVSLAQEACAARGWDAADRVAVLQSNRIATFLLKRSPFTPAEIDKLHRFAASLGFVVLYTPVAGTPALTNGASTTADNDYARLIRAGDRHAFYEGFPLDIRPTTDDRPFFFHTTRIRDQFQTAFGRSMLFGNGLSALMTLAAVSGIFLAGLVIVPMLVGTRGARVSGSGPWLAYFGCLGAGFMLLEVALLQRFVLLLGHPVYSLTVTLFALLVGTAAGSALTRGVPDARLGRLLGAALASIVALAALAAVALPPIVAAAVSLGRPARIALAVALVAPVGVALGVPLPAGIRLMTARRGELVAWAWAINGALSVIGATAAVFVAMNWGFKATLALAALTYALAGTIAAIARQRAASA
jgi:spermidine synthase